MGPMASRAAAAAAAAAESDSEYSRELGDEDEGAVALRRSVRAAGGGQQSDSDGPGRQRQRQRRPRFGGGAAAPDEPPPSLNLQRKRRVAPLLIAASGNETEGTATPTLQPSPPASAATDKPREERSYREFFPDLSVHMPLAVVAGDGSALATPASSASEAVTSSEAEAARVPAGKGAQSYAAQSAVVVLAPKRPVVGLPAARFRRVERERVRGARFVRPDNHYVRAEELTEKDLAARVEYDLDEADRRWLAALNGGRAARGAGEISAAQLEALLDGMEKEWFDLVKDAQRAITAMQQERLAAEESACAVCGEDECDNANAIVFCDGCNMAVHQDCYGVPYIPEGQWLCRRCMLSPAKDVACALCPQRGGAFKKTTGNKWAHVLCALWIPEVGIANAVYMEPIDGLDQIPRSRWRLACGLCQRRAGACIQCSHRQCVAAFHATCARRARLAMSVRADRRTGEPVFRAYCERHTPPGHTHAIDVAAPLRRAEVRRRRSVLGAAGDDDGARPAPDVVASAAADADVRALLRRAAAGAADASLQLTMRVFSPDRPVLNAFVVARVASRAAGRKAVPRAAAVAVARYWALKRRERHGAPLLKRLHLEPWTASATQQRAHEVAEGQRQGVVRRIRTDLERVRLLVECVRRREREKLRRVRLLVDYVRRFVAPLVDVLLPPVDELIDQRDPRGVLARPVSLDDAPDYRDVIAEPMDFGTVRAKVLAAAYPDVDAFARDLHLVVDNCMRYNKPNTYYYRLATRVKAHVVRLIAEARARAARLPIDPASGCLAVPFSREIFGLAGALPDPSSIQPATTITTTITQSAGDPGSDTTTTTTTTSEAEPEPEPSGPEPEPEPKAALPRPEPPARVETRSESEARLRAARRMTRSQAAASPPETRRLATPGRRVDTPGKRAHTGSSSNDDTPGKRQRRQSGWTIPTAARLGEDPQEYAAGTAVWAKMDSYPWFPAETCDAAGSDVPDDVGAGAGRAPDETTLVRFFAAAPAARQWRWVSPRQICRLGADPALDRDFFRARKARSSNMVRSVRAAYAQACEAKGVVPLAP